MKGLFSVKMSKIIKSLDLLVNIDETVFSRSTKVTKSRSVKEKECTSKNICFYNSISLVTAITSLGDVLAADTLVSVTSKLIISFLEELKKMIKETQKIPIENWFIIIDNASIHSSKEVKKHIIWRKLNFYFIPAYSPELAPIEKYFSILKRNVVR